MFLQQHIKVERDISVKIKGLAPSGNITPTGTDATGALPIRGICCHL